MANEVYYEDLKSKGTHSVTTKNPFFDLFGISSFDLSVLVDFCDEHTSNENLVAPYLTSDSGGLRVDSLELLVAILSDDPDYSPDKNILWWDKEEKEYIHKTLYDYNINLQLIDQAIVIANRADGYKDRVYFDEIKILNTIYCNNVYLRETYKDKRDTEDYYSLLNPAHLDHVTNSGLVNDINISGSGCIIWHPKLYFAIESGCVREFHPTLRLMLKDPYQDKNENVVAQPLPVFAGVGKIGSGAQIHVQQTLDTQMSDSLGTYSTTNTNESTLENLVAGSLDLTYNMNTNMWEAGTRQLLVKLVTDIEGVISPPLDIENIDKSEPDVFYKKDGIQNQASNFSRELNIGYGVPLYVHKGNKDKFGPAFLKRHQKDLEDSSQANTKDRIPIVNRTPRTFKANDLVLVSFINGEWIPFHLGTDEVGGAFGIGKWSFQKLIASSDCYFKDERFYYNSQVPDFNAGSGNRSLGLWSNPAGGPYDYNPDGSDPADLRNYKNPISDTTYLQRMRSKYYQSLRVYMGMPAGGGVSSDYITTFLLPGVQTDIYVEKIEQGHLVKTANLNLAVGVEIYSNLDDNYDEIISAVDADTTSNNWNIIPSTRYIQVTAFDQMGTFAGGKNLTNLIARTNINRGPSLEPDDDQDGFGISPEKTFEFFGPSFPDGYDSTQFGIALSRKNTDGIGCMPNIYDPESLEGDYHPLFFSVHDPMQNQGQKGWYIPTADTPAIDDSLKERNLSKTYGVFRTDQTSKAGMFGDVNDVNALNLPAEVATNGPFNSDGMPLEDFYYLQTNYGRRSFLNSAYNYGFNNMIDGTMDLFSVYGDAGGQGRFNWLFRINGGDLDVNGAMNTPYYGFKPVNNKRVSFLPLYAEVVASVDHDGMDKILEPPYPNSVHYPSIDLAYGMPRIMAGPYSNLSNFWGPYYTGVYSDGLKTTHLFGGNHIFTRSLISKHPKLIVWNFDNTAVNAIDAKEWIIPYNAGLLSGQNGGHAYVTYDSPGGNHAVDPTYWPTTRPEDGNCVGIIAAKCPITFRGTEIQFTCNQQFGLQSKLGGISGGSVSEFFAVGFAMVGGNAYGGLATADSETRWGQSTNHPWDFHTTALYVKVYDQWPDEQTVYDARYFSVFHYNPGVLLSKPEQEEEAVYYISEAEISALLVEGMSQDDIDTNYKKRPDILEKDGVDFRIPTDVFNEVIPLKTIIGPSGPSNDDPLPTAFAPKGLYRVNTIRRGQLLSNGGFRYFRNVCGVNQYVIKNPGVLYKSGEILSVTGGSGKNALIQIVTTKDVGNGIVETIKILDRGEGYVTEDFGDGTDANPSLVKVSGGTGTGLFIKFTNGIIYQMIEKDEAPELRSSSILLTSDNADGRGNDVSGQVRGIQEKSIQISNPNPTGKYDLFFHFHNDIAHTRAYGGGPMGVYAQHVTLELNAI